MPEAFLATVVAERHVGCAVQRFSRWRHVAAAGSHHKSGITAAVGWLGTTASMYRISRKDYLTIPI